MIGAFVDVLIDVFTVAIVGDDVGMLADAETTVVSVSVVVLHFAEPVSYTENLLVAV